ncbi:MAG: cytochrome c3 family protein [Parasutterella excrementihominis]
MKTTKVLLSAVLSLFLVGAVFAQNAPEAMKKEQCLACHGPTFDDLIKKNVQAQSDSGPVNPHVWIPHAGGPEKAATECIDCHAQHSMPRNRDTKIPCIS